MWRRRHVPYVVANLATSVSCIRGGRDPMVYHPHIHLVVPGGGVLLDENRKALRWSSTAENFLVHHGTLINVFKGKLTDGLRECGIYDEVPESAWYKKSVVDIEPVGDGSAVLKYLAPVCLPSSYQRQANRRLR